MRINKRNVDALPVSGKEKVYMDSDLKGFGVKVRTSARKSYIAQARVNGKIRRVTLGRHGEITPQEARKRAQTELGKMSGKVDPSEERQRERALSVTLREVADAYQRDRRDLKDSTKRDIHKHVNGAFKAWADKPVSAITRDKVTRRFREMSERSPAQANQAFRVLRALLNYARAQYRADDDEPVLPDNPVKVLSDSRLWNRVQARNSYVPLERLGAWWSAVQARRLDPSLSPLHRSAADLVAFLAVTGLRLGEARMLRWDQVDLDDASIQLTDTKNREDVTLPLSAVAADILRNRQRTREYVFPGRDGGPLSDPRGALRVIGDQTGVHVTAHDLRRTFSAVAGEVGVELWVCKALMNHVQSADITLSAYTDLSDVRRLRPQADKIGEYFEQQRAIAEGGDKVVRLQGIG